MELRKLVETAQDIEDPRRQWGNLRHKLEDILVIGLCSTVSMGKDFEDMEVFGYEREAWLRTFLELPNGIPDSDTFRRVFERVDPAQVSTWMNNWLETERQPGGRLVNLDGKTICGSGNEVHSAYHVVSAWVGQQALTLGELQVGEKSNEIKAVPELLDLIDIEGDVVTADAMSCQRAIAEKIIEKKGDYILALKGNQSTMAREVEEYFAWLDKEPKEMPEGAHWTGPVEKGHGRIERREVTAISAEWFEEQEKWKDLKTFVRVRSTVAKTVEDKGKETLETVEFDRFYISSLNETPEKFGEMIRGHWSIENHLHWSLDVIFGEDASRAKKDNSPLVMNVLRKSALSLLKAANVGKQLSLQKKRLKAALSPSFLGRILAKK